MGQHSRVPFSARPASVPCGLSRPEARALWRRRVHRSVIVRRFMDAKNLVSPPGAAIASLAGPGVRPATSRATMELASTPLPPATGPRLVGRRLTLCVSGSIAAYKAAALARLLLREGAQVQPLMTRSAERSLGQATLAGLTGRPVQHDLFGSPGEPH